MEELEKDIESTSREVLLKTPQIFTTVQYVSISKTFFYGFQLIMFNFHHNKLYKLILQLTKIKDSIVQKRGRELLEKLKRKSLLDAIEGL